MNTFHIITASPYPHWFFKIFVKKCFQSTFWFQFNEIHGFRPIWILFVWSPIVQIYFVRFQVFRCGEFYHFFHRKCSNRHFYGFQTSRPITFLEQSNGLISKPAWVFLVAIIDVIFVQATTFGFTNLSITKGTISTFACVITWFICALWKFWNWIFQIYDSWVPRTIPWHLCGSHQCWVRIRWCRNKQLRNPIRLRILSFLHQLRYNTVLIWVYSGHFPAFAVICYPWRTFADVKNVRNPFPLHLWPNSSLASR